MNAPKNHRTGLLLMLMSAGIMQGVVGVALSASQPSSQPTSPVMSQPAAEIAVSASFLRKLTEMPIQRTENLDMVVDGAHIVSQINGVGVGYISPWATSMVGLGFCIDAQSNVNTNIDATIAGPARVFVRTDAVALTSTNTRKCFLLNDSELKSYASKTNANTRLTVQNLDVWAGGLFPRLKERIGERKAREQMAIQIPKQEQQISQQAQDTINSMLDQKTVDLKARADHEWRTWLRDATTHSKLLPHPPQFFSTNDALYAYVPTDLNKHQLELKPAANEALMVRVRPQYLRDVVKIYLAGQTVSDIDAISAVMKQQGDFSSPEELLGSSDEVLVRFNSEKPVDFKIEQDLITATLRFDSLRTNGKDYGAVDLVFPVKVTTDKTRGAMIEIPETLDFHSRATGETVAELNEICTARWSMIAANRIFALEEIRQAKAPWLPVKLMAAIASQGALTLTAINGDEQAFAAIRKGLSDRFKL
jgi:hypothetical protein